MGEKIFQGKSVIITGGAGAIGSAEARAFAAGGAHVFFNDIDEEKGAALCREIEQAGGRAQFFPVSVSDGEGIGKMVEKAAADTGGIHILVNNAGYNVGGNKRKPITEYDEADVRMVTNICLDGMYHCCRFVLPYMKQAGGGKIVNTGSVTGFHAPLKWQAPYNAAKAAVHNITRTMAAAYGKYHINVNAVIPGSVMNEGLKGMVYDTDDKARSMIEHIPLGRTGRPDDIANAVCFLCSPYADYITGCLLNVDGGWAAAYSAE